MNKKTRKMNPYVVFPILFFLIFAVFFGISAAGHKKQVANGLVDVPKEAQTIEYMSLAIGTEMYINDDKLDQTIPTYFYIGGEWFAPKTSYPFTVWQLEGSTVFEGNEDYIETFIWTTGKTVSDEAYELMVSDLSVDFGEPEVDGDVYTWTKPADGTLGPNEAVETVVLQHSGNGVSITGSL